MAGGGERLNLKKIVFSLNSDEVIRLTKILLDGDKEDAFTFIKEVLKPQVDQATRSQ
jgi:hypothetical protein